jgi:hypothetical protein
MRTKDGFSVVLSIALHVFATLPGAGNKTGKMQVTYIYRVSCSNMREVLFKAYYFLKSQRIVCELLHQYTYTCPSQGRYLHTEQYKQSKRTDIHALSGIPTHDPSVRAGEDRSCVRPLEIYH